VNRIQGGSRLTWTPETTRMGSDLTVGYVRYAFVFPRFFRIESPRISIR
jgi:hypothetical protein